MCNGKFKSYNMYEEVDKLLTAIGLDPSIELGDTGNRLVPTEKDGVFRLEPKYPSVRVIGDSEAVDPIDGPFMSLGYSPCPGLKVGRIEVTGEGIIYLTLVEDE